MSHVIYHDTPPHPPPRPFPLLALFRVRAHTHTPCARRTGWSGTTRPRSSCARGPSATSGPQSTHPHSHARTSAAGPLTTRTPPPARPAAREGRRGADKRGKACGKRPPGRRRVYTGVRDDGAQPPALVRQGTRRRRGVRVRHVCRPSAVVGVLPHYRLRRGYHGCSRDASRVPGYCLTSVGGEGTPRPAGAGCAARRRVWLEARRSITDPNVPPLPPRRDDASG